MESNEWTKEDVPANLTGRKVCCHGVSLFKDCKECMDQMTKDDEMDKKRA